MPGLGYAMAGETLQGWRIWRVLPFERLDGTRTVRLCAVGTYGIPKLWEPRRPIVAVCSSFTSDHEAPWVDHECGIWALKREEDARRRMVSWMQTQGGEPLGWACGQVSLWGRVIEHEHGWRAQYAYPYAITVESIDGDVAAALRAEYVVDVDWNSGDLYEAALAKRKARDEAEENRRAATRAETKRLQKETKAAIARLGEIGTELRAAGAATRTTSSVTQAERAEQWEQERKEREDAIRAAPPIPQLNKLSVDEVLAAFVTCVVGNHETYLVPREEVMLHPWSVDAVAACVLYGRRKKPPFSWGRDCVRPGFKEACARVLALMREARDSDLLAYGLPFENRHSHSSGGDWFITRRGLGRVAKLGARTTPYYDGHREAKRHDIDLAKAVRLLRRHDRPMFVEEVEVLMPTWVKERRAAQRKGRRAYREWLQERRATGRPQMLWFTDEEVEATIRRMRKPVRTVDAMQQLAPAEHPGDRFRSEVAHLSAQFVRLHRDGRVTRRKEGNVIWWETAPA